MDVCEGQTPKAQNLRSIRKIPCSCVGWVACRHAAQPRVGMSVGRKATGTFFGLLAFAKEAPEQAEK